MSQLENKREIIIVTEFLTNGGAERVLVELVNEWVNSGYKISVVQTMPQMYNTSYAISNEVTFINLNFQRSRYRYFNTIKCVYLLIRILKEHQNATVLVFINSAMRLVLVSSFFVKNRLIVSERNNPYFSPPRKSSRAFRNLTFRIADGCVFQTQYALDYFSKAVRKKGVIIPNPINPELPEINQGKREKRIISACRLDAQKNIPMMIKSFKKLIDYYPEYRLYIYGRGPLEDEIKQFIKYEKLEEKVFLPGFSNNIYEEMNKSAIFVLSSDYEGISNAMLEALAMGLPSVVTDCPVGGAKMVIENNVNGILVPVGDVEAMFEGMKKILDDELFAKFLSKNAAKIRYKYPVEKVAKMWLDVLF